MKEAAVCSARSQRMPPTPSGFSGRIPCAVKIAMAINAITRCSFSMALPYCFQSMGCDGETPIPRYSGDSSHRNQRSIEVDWSA